MAATIGLNYETGKTITLNLHVVGTVAATESGIVMTESARTGYYTGTTTNYGLFTADILSSGVKVADGPVKTVDGSTAVVGHGLLDCLPANVWTYGTRTLTITRTAVAEQFASGSVVLHRGDSVSFSITGLGSIANRTALWFTVKKKYGNPADSAAIIQISEDDGLIYLNGSAVGTGSPSGGITVDDENAGDITIDLDPEDAAALKPNDSLVYDVQVLRSTGAVNTLDSGTCKITEDVTRSVS